MLFPLFGRSGSHRRPPKIAAIRWRLYALCDIAKYREFRAWSLGIDLEAGIDPKVFAVAADEPGKWVSIRTTSSIALLL